MADTVLTAIIALKDNLSAAVAAPIKALKSLGNVFGDLQKAANVALLAIKGGLILLGKEAIDSARHLTQLSRITGINTKTLQELGAAAEATGANFDRLSTGMKLLAEKANKAASGNKGFIDLFARAGLNIYNTNGHLKDAEQLFLDYADVVAKAGNKTQQMGLSVEFLGRSGEELIPMLQKGSAGLREFADVAQRSGYIMSNDTIKALDIAGKQMSALKTIAVNMTGEWMASTGVTIPKIIDLWMRLAIALQEVIGWVKKAGNQFVESWKFVGEAFVIILDGIINGIKTGLKAGLDSIENWVLNVAQFLRDIGRTEWGDNLANGFIKLKAALSNLKGSTQPIKDIGVALDEMTGRVEAQNAQVDKKTQDTVNDLKQRGGAIQSHMKLIAKTNEEFTNNVGNDVDTLNEKMHDMTEGFTLASEEFIRNSGNWKDAWLGLFHSIESGISSVMTKFIMEGGKLKDVMKDIFKSITESFMQMITKMLTQRLLASLLGQLMPGETTSASNMFAQGGGGGGAPGGGGNAAQLAAMGMGSGLPMLGSAMSTAQGGAGGGTLFGMAGGNQTMALGSIAGLGFGTQMAYQANQGPHPNTTQGTVGGVVAGAALGTMIMPGIGTAVGAVVGGVAGFVTSNSAKEKARKQREAAEKKQKEQEEAMRAQARILLAADIRAKYGGGLADVAAVTDIGQILSGGITDETLDKLGAKNIVDQGNEIGTGVSSIQVGAPNIVINANVAGSYDVQRFAQDLGIHLASSIRTAVAGASI